MERQQETERRSRKVDRKRREIATRIADLQAQLADEEMLSQRAVFRDNQFAADRVAMATSRQVADVRVGRQSPAKGKRTEN